MTQATWSSRLAQSPTATQHGVQALFALTFAVTWVLALYWNTGVAMVNIWQRSDTFAHAFLVVPIAAWLIWRKRDAVSALAPAPSLATLWLVAFAAAAWQLGELTHANSVTQLAFVAMLVLCVPTLVGWSVTQAIAFPLAFLFFSVPIGEFLIPQLMEWTAYFTIVALRLTGIPVYREGLQFVIPSGSWSVVEACSGVRYLIASLTVGTLFAYLNFRSNKRRLLFAMVSVVVPVIANWVRAYLIVVLGHFSGNQIASGVDHLIYGWAFFGVVMLAMFIIGARWADVEQGNPQGLILAPTHQKFASIALLWTAVGCLATVVAIPQGIAWAGHREADSESVQLAMPVVLSGDWHARPPGVPQFSPHFPEASAEVNTSYANQGQVVGLYLGYYRNQNRNRKLISSSNTLVRSGDPRWVQGLSGQQTVELGNQMVTLRTAEVIGGALADTSAKARLIVWQFYWVNGWVTANDYLAAAYGALSRLRGQGDSAATIIVYADNRDMVNAEASLESFLSANFALIDGLLRKEQQHE